MRRSSKYLKLLGLAFLVLILGIVVLLAWRNSHATNRPLALSMGTGAESSTSTPETTATTSFSTTGEIIPLTSAAAVSPTDSTAALLQGMTLTFDGEFNSFSRYVDANGNVTCNPGGTGIWQTVYYFCSRTNAANDEAEVYVDPGFIAFLKKESTAIAAMDPSNPFSVSDGILDIKAMPATQQISSAVGPWAQYTSGMITTQFSFSQEYGYFEMRAKLPKGKGLWPAFWLLPVDKSWPPEIDAMEAFGGTSSTGEGGITMIHYGSHSTVNGQSCGGWYNVGVDITQSFNTYGVDIEPTGITYYFDGKPYATCPANSETDKPFYMLVNLAVGGPGSWPSTPDMSNVWPANMYIEYVRAYQKK